MQRRKILQPGIQRFVLDRIGIQLLIDPFGQAHLLDAFEVAGPRSVRETVQRMKDRFVYAEVGNRQAFQNGILLGLFVLRGHSGARRIQTGRKKKCRG